MVQVKYLTELTSRDLDRQSSGREGVIDCIPICPYDCQCRG